MTMTDFQACPCCDTMVPHQHWGRKEGKTADTTTVALYCQGCDRIYEQIWVLVGDRLHMEYQLDYWRRTEPENFRRAMQRLEEMTGVTIEETDDGTGQTTVRTVDAA